MNNADLFNMTLLDSTEEVDEINKRFYDRYNYPPPPLLFQRYSASLARQFINQDIGYWRHERILENPKIWVAGCGSNQALFTALKFPECEVFGTDISTQSLNICWKNAQEIGVNNLHLEEKSLNDIDYVEQFDYIICTGVVHHNARPTNTLAKISAALKKNGVLEFMVYNYYHRLLTTACQKAIRTFYDSEDSLDMELELSLVKGLISFFPYDSLMGNFLRSHAEMHEAEMTDYLIQPVEFSYTIESLGQLLSKCNLEYLLPCQNQFDVSKDAFTWNIRFNNDELRSRYDSLPDIKRWQISNLLLCNDSPMLWFYLQRKDSEFRRKSEKEVCDEFMDTVFHRKLFPLTNYVLTPQGKYKLKDIVNHPSENSIKDSLARKVYHAVNQVLKMKDIFEQLKIAPDFENVNRVRIKLTTSGYPYLITAK